LNTSEAASLARIKVNLVAANNTLFGDELDSLAAQCYQEYTVNLAMVKEAFNLMIVEHDTADKA